MSLDTQELKKKKKKKKLFFSPILNSMGYIIYVFTA